MKKSVKRILCAALACSLSWTLATEQVLRLFASGTSGKTTETAAAFENVTGQFDTTALREENFNAQVLSANAKPTYETRTVIVSLDGQNAVAAADGQNVSAYLRSFAGRKTVADIQDEQNEFLRKLAKMGISYKLERNYDTVANAVAIEVNTKYVSKIKKMAGVKSAVITSAYSRPDAVAGRSAAEVVNQTSVYDTGIYDATKYTTGATDYGKGTVVAVLDTGLDYTHNAFLTLPDEPAWSEKYVADVMKDNVLAAETKSGGLSVSDVYVSAKVPFAYDYADDDSDVYPSYSNHGTHVAGIIGGYDENGYTDKDGVNVWEDTNGNGVWDLDEKAVTFRGVVPNAQLVICKVFTDDLDDEELGGATPEDIIAALEDCVTLGVDVINMSLGTSCGFTTTNDGDDEGELLNAVYESIESAGISLVCAASNDYSAGYGGAFGTNLTTNPDSGTVGSPSTFAASLSVASISGQESPYMFRDTNGNGSLDENETAAFYEESRDENGKEYDFAEQMLGKQKDADVFEYVVIPGTGSAADYTTQTRRLLGETDASGKKRLALIERGDNTFQDKVEVAMEMGAAAVIIYNNVAGIIRMNLGEIENPCPAVSIGMDAGYALADTNGDNKRDYNGVGKIVVSKDTAAGPFMSEFSSWGPTHDLKLKPEITAHGGEITSTVPGGYGEQSGTSMASPNMAGVMALVRSYIQKDARLSALTGGDPVKVNRLANQLIMSTATTVRDQDGKAYSPRKQGAGLGSLENVIDKTAAYLYTENAESDYRPKLELGDDKQRTGVYENLNFSLQNFGGETLRFATASLVMTETVAKDGLAVAEQAKVLAPKSVDWQVSGDGVTFDKQTGEIVVPAGKTAAISVKIELSEGDKAYLEQENKNGDKVFENGMYVEGFLQLLSKTDGQCGLSVPFLAFYGDWDSAPMLDYTAFEISESEQDATVLEENKLKEQVWATQPFATYWNEKYILPMGGYVYLLDENDEKMYTKEEYCAVSRYNEYYGDDSTENYMTSTGIKAVYAGLLRNARVVKYKLYDERTGEVILSDFVNRVGKAYSGGGTPTPANVELELFPEEYNLAANGQYRMEFEFFTETPAAGETAKEENTFAFSFTVDYEAPVLENVRVRYYNYKDGTKEKQKIYLDVDVYDNHYAQAIMLCYPKKKVNAETGEEETVLQLATEYPTPVRNAVKNGTTTVSIEITDIYEEYGKQLYLQIDDYAINSCLYQVDIAAANAAQTPDNGFSLAEGEEEITLGLYETHKVALRGIGNADLSNYVWSSANPAVANVKNGEIVGLKAGETSVFVSDPDQDVNKVKQIRVVVTDEVKGTLVSVPSISFGVIKTSTEALQKAVGLVSVNAGQTIPLRIETEPFYHPMTNLSFKWSSTDETVATVDENGVVKTLKKGTATIGATVLRSGVETRYFANVTLRVEDEFDVSNYTLVRYNGLGYNEGSVAEKTDILVIPTDRNIMYIGEDAFKDNENVRRIVIPASVVEIREGAFENCKALEEVYFVSTAHRKNEGKADEVSIDFSDLSLVHRRAFYNCKALKKVDLANVKTITLDKEVFFGCESLSEIVDMPSIGTAYHSAFENCVALKTVDLSGLHVSGERVFAGCVGLENIVTDTFTAIGKDMFENCTGLRNAVVIRTAKVGDGAFGGCVNLKGATFAAGSDGKPLVIALGAGAFEDCGSGTKGGFVLDFGGQTVKELGDRAFAGAKLVVENETFVLPDGLTAVGANLFEGCQTVKTVALGNTELGEGALKGEAFAGLSVAVAADSTKYAAGALATGDEGVIYALSGGKKVEIVYVNAAAKGDGNGKLDLSGLTTLVAVGDYAFAGVKGLSEVVLPATVQTLGKGAFENSLVTALDFGGAAITEIPERAFRGSKIAKMVLPASIVNIKAYAFTGAAVQELKTQGAEMLVGIREVGDYAFATSLLKTVSFADGAELAAFGDGVFAGAQSLQSVVLPSLESLGVGAFRGASALQKVTFGARSVVTGEYTFAGTAIEKAVWGDGETALEKGVLFREGQTEIGEGLFYGATALTEIALSETVTEIGDYAFYQAKKLTAANLESVVAFGEYAFFETALTTLELSAAKRLGAYAFASLEKEASYQFVAIPVAVEIGAFAFYGGGEAVVELPQTVRSIGQGAFAASKKLIAFTFARTGTLGGDEVLTTENGAFFVDGGVLYRYIDEQKTQFAVLCYPAALVGEVLEGETKKEYKIKEGTVRVEAYAFYGLNKGALDRVIIPYSVKAIGNAAFYDSGASEYAFESIQAPVLETAYRADIESAIEALANASTVAFYKGYYYSNFQKDLYNYTHYVGEKSGLKMTYPENGKGYGTYIYRLYFGSRKTAGVMMTDDTRTSLRLVSALAGADEVATWLAWNASDAALKARVESFSAQVKAARASYNNVLKDEAQAAIFGEENGAKLLAVEEKLREVKAHFNIPVFVSTIAASKTSEHKTEYTEGDSFDPTGLVVTVTYDDGSTKELTLDSQQLVIESEEILTKYDQYVIVKYTENGKTKSAYLVITVGEKELSSIEKYPEEANVMRSVLIYGGLGMMLIGGLGVLVMLAIQRRKVAKAASFAVGSAQDTGADAAEVFAEMKAEQGAEVAASEEETPQE
ncbi:MAG: leucine-rich repeat protein [Clostridia bacterium]|nr:leucine-rich repeat protein [Clostridia bacterium]